ncbi:MAG: response regulator [Chloroflexota bacterium]
MRPRVLIADDHIVWRRGLRSVLEGSCDIICEAAEGNEAVKEALASQPDVVVMDIRMPGMDGLAAARQIKESLPGTGVVIVSATDEDGDIHEAIRSGVNGYIVKDDTPETMVEAVRNAAEGKAYLPPLIAKRVLDSVARTMNSGKAGPNGDVPLTSREVTVLRLMAEGRRHKEIARDLSISERTVGNHISSIYNKLGIFDRAQAILYAVKKGIVRI